MFRVSIVDKKAWTANSHSFETIEDAMRNYDEAVEVKTLQQEVLLRENEVITKATNPLMVKGN